MKKQKNLYDILIKKYGSSIIEYRKQWERAKKQEIKLKYPLHINFELTFGCNFKCDFCIHSLPLKEWDYKIDVKKKILFDKYCEIIDEGVKYGLCSVELNGINEPLFCKNISKYIKYAKNAGILVISFHTNSLLLSKNISEDILNSGLTTIIFSLDAFTRKTYKIIRNNDNYKKILKNITNFLKIKKEHKKEFPITRVSFVENKVNIKEFDNFNKFWKDKVDIVSKVSFCNPFVDKDKYYFIENKYRIKGNAFIKCTESYCRLFIQNNGNVLPCCSFFGGSMPIGNIYKNSLYNIWNSKKIEKIRKKINGNIRYQPTACLKCRFGMCIYSR